VINTDLFPTGEMVRDITHTVDVTALRETLNRWCRDDVIEVPARTLAEHFFGDTMVTNLIVVGAALQGGRLPLSAQAIEQANTINGVSVSSNITAFRIGRQWVADPLPLLERIAPRPATANEEIERRTERLGGRRAASYRQLMAFEEPNEETRRLLAIRVAELIDYQSVAYARSYLDTIHRVAEREAQAGHTEGQVTAAVARNLHKLMAYKDEYEVARLFLQPEFTNQIQERFDHPVRIRYHLHPPLARRLGRKEKLAIGPGARTIFRLLRHARHLRATPLDPFGHQASRREERQLITWYLDLIEQATSNLDRHVLPIVTELLELPGDIRGYEEVKTRNAARARLRGKMLLARLKHPHPLTIHDNTPSSEGQTASA
jgi:indolepyruvate ferredoxin oxidoreductase